MSPAPVPVPQNTPSVVATTAAAAETTTFVEPSPTPASTSSLHGGVIAAIVISVLAFLIILVALGIHFYKRYQRRRAEARIPPSERHRRSTNYGIAPLLEPEKPHERRESVVSQSYSSGGNPWEYDSEHGQPPMREADAYASQFPYHYQKESVMRESSTPVSAHPKNPLPPPPPPPLHPVRGQSSYGTPTSAASESTESMYSQLSASTHMHTATFDPSPVPKFRTRPLYDEERRDSDSEDEEEPSLIRGNTRVLGKLLKTRAKHGRGRGGEVHRNGTKVSRIERWDSIKSIPSPDDGGSYTCTEQEEEEQRTPKQLTMPLQTAPRLAIVTDL